MTKFRKNPVVVSDPTDKVDVLDEIKIYNIHSISAYPAEPGTYYGMVTLNVPDGTILAGRKISSRSYMGKGATIEDALADAVVYTARREREMQG